MSTKRLFWLQVVLTFVCTAVLITGISLSYRYGFFKRADNFFYDLHFNWRGPVETSGQVALVLMDEKSAAELNRRKGTWSRAQLAGALTNLCAAGAEVIGLDMILAAPDLEPENDIALAQAIADCNNLILARVSAAEGVDEVAALGIFQEGMIGDGFIDVPLDEDEIFRRVRFLNAKPKPDGGLQLLPSLSLELVRSYLNLDFAFDFSMSDYFLLGAKDEERLRLPYPELLINYYGDFTAFTHLSYADVVNNRFPPELVKGRIIIIGSSLATQKDFYTTPFTRFKKPSAEYKEKFASVVEDVLAEKDLGVACHAHAVETILKQAFISRSSSGQVLVAVVLIGLAGLLFYVPRIGMVLEVLLLAAGLAAIVGAGHLVFLKKLLWLDTAPMIGMLLAQFVVGVMLQKAFDKKKAAMVSGIFGKYVSPGVVDELLKGDIETTLVGHSMELTMLFSDIRGFTTISEKLGAKDTSLLLNNYFDAMIPIVMEHDGTLDKLMGDAIMAFFGAPVPVPGHPVKAAAAALQMVETLAALRRESEVKGMADLQIGIGLNTAEVTVGNLGSREFMDYTIIGDGVNLASRLEGINKVYGTQIIISEFTAAVLDERFLLRELDLVKVKGKDKAVAIYELMGYRDRADEVQLGQAKTFTQGLAAFRQQEWGAATGFFSELLQMVPADKAARLYLDRIEYFRNNPPGDNWDGVTSFDHK